MSNNRNDDNQYSSKFNVHDYFARFDQISDDFKKSSARAESAGEIEAPPTEQKGTAKERRSKTGRTKKKKYRIHLSRLLLALTGLFLILATGAFIFVYMIIKDAAEIDPNNIYASLSESSILYDQHGNVIDNLYDSPDGKRTNIAYSDIPANLRNAFVAVEDRTFWEHHGFNYIRMVGAIRDSVFGGDRIRGTSTITQQLARNLYLMDKRSERTLNRKVLEAYYAVILEKHLTKQQILEAYLNTIFLGYNSSGVQAASQAYFSKEVWDLTLTECVALAAIPQSSSNYALIRVLPSESVAEENEDIVYRGGTYTYLYNGDVTKDRRLLILRFMNEQGYITDSEYTAAVGDDLRAYINPSLESATETSSYFTDYVIQQVIRDLIDDGYSSEEARYQLYNAGWHIYTTLEPKAQAIIEAEFSDNENFPRTANLRRDSAGNVLGANRNILLYHRDTYFDADGAFTLTPDEYTTLPNGDMLVYAGNRLNFFRTEVQGRTDYSVEFKSIYQIIDNIFYIIEGGFIAIPQEFKGRDNDGNLIIDARFFAERPDFFTASDRGLSIPARNYTLKQSVVQPQSAMVITDNATGHIQAMVGGRSTTGRLLFNRADSPRQPGSTIKPIGVYGPGLQLAVETMRGGSTQTFITFDGAADLYGKYMTAASIIDDAPLTIQGRLWPRNIYPGYRGLHSLRDSLVRSVNVNAVKAFMQIGPEYSSQFLKKLGLTTVVETGATNDMNAAALALGGMTHGVSPLQMAGAYGAFVNGGVYTEPTAYTKISNRRGETILEKVPRTNEVMDEGVAFIMLDILRDVVTSGTGRPAAVTNQPTAGKTGTTADNVDACFTGLTPQYTAALWIGNDVYLELSQGSAAAARLWGKIMNQVCEGLPTGSFPAAPSGVISVSVDITTGLLPSDGSGGVRSEYFVRGTEPTDFSSSVRAPITICTESGYRATPSCLNRQTVYDSRSSSAPSDEEGGEDGEPLYAVYTVPRAYCPLHNPDPETYPTTADMSESDPSEEPGDSQTTDEPPRDGQGNPPQGPNTDQLAPNPGGNPAPTPNPEQSVPNPPNPPNQSNPPPVVEEEMPEWLRPSSH